ncbi:MAG: hypothetical protein K5798_05245 [Nitrosopumilus sp.]|uniref:hypothetical protein n=1 Tax=Nitrosopumilus sp. TaxID=2024843 RepID=UPI00243095F2|nr:hypothetical protein [Nitrosopumilus sp.]MCV0366650.1 hypothetical protein [Nitrosopumilus sp.]
MKKNSLLLIIAALSISVFIYGVLVGTYKIFPYGQLDYVKTISLNEKNGSDEKNIIYENDVNSLIHINTVDDISKLRNNLIDFIWSGDGFPNSKLPDSVQTNISTPLYENFKNLKRIDQINVVMDYGVNSISYLFIPESSNNKLIIYHQGHAGDFYKGKETIQFFLEHDYTVMAFSMPLLGMNDQPVIIVPNIGTIKLTSHEHLRFLESSDLSPIKFFMEPIAVSLNYLDENYDFSSYHMVGLSGGGWTATLYPAIDTRISQSYSVAGSVPIYLRSIPQNYGDYEQWLPALYQNANYLDLYIINSYGDDRKFIQIFNKYDSCCFSGELFKSYENEIKESIKKLKHGHFEIYLDETHKTHKISESALKIILDSMRD